LEHLAEGVQAILARRVEGDPAVGQLDRAVRVLEVEPGGDLPLGLVDCVADLLPVDLGDDVEARHAPDGSPVVQRRSPTAIVINPGSVPEWPKGTDCKPVDLRLRRFESFPAHPTRCPAAAGHRRAWGRLSRSCGAGSRAGAGAGSRPRPPATPCG